MRGLKLLPFLSFTELNNDGALGLSLIAALTPSHPQCARSHSLPASEVKKWEFRTRDSSAFVLFIRKNLKAPLLSLSLLQKVTLFPGARVDFHVFLKRQTLICFFIQSHSQIWDLFCNSSYFSLSGGCVSKLKNYVFSCSRRKAERCVQIQCLHHVLSGLLRCLCNYLVNYVHLANPWR